MIRVRPMKPKGAAARGIAVPPAAMNFVALSLLTAPNRARMPNPDDGPPCHLCTARCCKYFAFEIDRPTAAKDFDTIRWYLMHEGIVVWVQDGDWYIEVRTVCKHLQPDNMCGIYETRPEVCRDYGASTDDPCEYFTEHLKHDQFSTRTRSFRSGPKKSWRGGSRSVSESVRVRNASDRSNVLGHDRLGCDRGPG